MSGFDITKVLGAGTDTIDKGVLGLPFIQIVQKGSPEFDETHKDYAEKKIDGCKPGNVFFTPTRKLLATPLTVIPLAITSLYTEWKPRPQGGGFAGNQPLSVVGNRNYRKGAANTPEEHKEWLGDNELKFTIYAALKFLQGDEWVRGLISFNSTQLKPARIWQKQILNLRYPNLPDAVPPVFAAAWKFNSQPESNVKGGWYGWNIALDRMLDPQTDQKLLEEAFSDHREEQAKLPRVAAPVLAIQSGTEPF